MSEPTSDALFGADGTQAPEPLPDSQTGLRRGTGRGAPELPAIPPPPVPAQSALQEVTDAALGDDAGAAAGAVEQDPAAAAVRQVAGPAVPDANVADAPKTDVPQTNIPKVNVAAPQHATPTEAGSPSPPRRPVISALTPPTPPRPRRPAGLRYRPPMAGTSRNTRPGADPRRRIRRERGELPLWSSSDGGATAFFLTILIIIGLLVYFIITTFMNSLSNVLP